jgi:AraC-like DNA-binding protein
MTCQQIECHDAEELSHSLRHTNVSAMQIDRGKFSGELSVYGFGDWHLQHLSFKAGRATCRGDSPKHNHAIVVPLRLSERYNLLGRAINETSIGLYAPKSEHLDTTSAGAKQVVIIPSAGFVEAARADHQNRLSASGSHHISVGLLELDHLRRTLAEVHTALTLTRLTDPTGTCARCLADELHTALWATLSSWQKPSKMGRPELPRATILRKLRDWLERDPDEPVFVSEICADLGLSFATLRRIFIEWYGVPPARYLLMRRYYIARRMLRRGKHSSIAEVAQRCGFWDASRFSSGYQSLFGELPSVTVKNAAHDGQSSKGRR